jgi:hypothetical protein
MGIVAVIVDAAVMAAAASGTEEVLVSFDFMRDRTTILTWLGHGRSSYH